jgi:two-component system chemotaxis sensor kinase CheA
VYRLRGNLLPLVYLNHVLQVQGCGTPGEVNIIVLQADDRQFGLVVDAIHDTEEIVVKPLQKQLKGLAVFSGATIMGDGKVALILDVLGLAQRAQVISGTRERSLSEKATTTQTGERHSVLLFTTTEGSRMAIPLSQVSQLEVFPRAAIERVGTRDMVQYRGEILPLLSVGKALRRHGPHAPPSRNSKQGHRRRPQVAARKDEEVPVVVYASEGRRIGLIVGRILDIVEETISARSEATRPGVLFTAVIQERVTEFLDVEGLLRATDRTFFAASQAIPVEV